MNVEDNTQIEDKDLTELSQLGQLSDKANMIITELNESLYGKAKDKILELIDVLKNEDRLPDKQVVKVLLTKVKFMSRTSIYRALEDQGITRPYTKPKALPDPDRQTQEIEDKTIEYVPKQTDKDIPTPQEQEYIKSVETTAVPSYMGIPEDQLTIEQLRQRNADRYFKANPNAQRTTTTTTVVETTVPPQPIEIEDDTVVETPQPQQQYKCMSSGVIQCPLKVMSNGNAYQVMVTVRIAAGHKVKLDPIQRMDIVKA